MSGWPEKPGVPLNPERDGWHWLKSPRDFVRPCLWHHTSKTWLERGSIGAMVIAGWRYLGPCLTPAELTARDAATFQRGAEAMREQAAREIECGCAEEFRRKVASVPPNAADRWNLCGSTHCPAIDAANIRALPIPEDKA